MVLFVGFDMMHSCNAIVECSHAAAAALGPVAKTMATYRTDTPNRMHTDTFAAFETVHFPTVLSEAATLGPTRDRGNEDGSSTLPPKRRSVPDLST